MLINYTNHPSEFWSESQKRVAIEKYEEIVDIPFCSVNPSWTEEEVYDVACKEYEKILKRVGDKKCVVLCQGEATLSFLLIKFLMWKKIEVVSTVSNRVAEEKIENGVYKKTAIFEFQGFRSYDTRNFPGDIKNKFLHCEKFDFNYPSRD